MRRCAILACLLLGCGDDGGGGVDGSTSSSTSSGSVSTSTTGSTLSTSSTSSTATSEATTDDASSSGVAGSSSSGGDAATTGSTGGTAGSTGSGSTGALLCDDIGERVYAGDGCNFCDCTEAGLENCTARTCVPIHDGCNYDGVHYDYAEVFPSTDKCNDCVCAASGLACTRREKCVDGLEEGAILLEELDASCGGIDEFTGQWVLDGLEPLERYGPLDYANDGPLYPETLPDTMMTARVTLLGGYIVCRVPAPGQEAIDMEAILEWQTDDGAFDEGQHTYIRRNYGGFLDAVVSVATVEPGDIYGTYEHDCFDAGPLAFDMRFQDDDSATGSILKVCETDLALLLGAWSSAAP